MPSFTAPEPRRLHAFRSLALRGRGRVVIYLEGTGHLRLRRGRFDDFTFEGNGLPRHVSAEYVHLTAASGRLVLEGESLEVLFSGGCADADVTGVFDLELRPAQTDPGRRPAALRRAA